MYLVNVEEGKGLEIESRREHLYINGKEVSLDFEQTGTKKFKVFGQNRVHEIEITTFDKDEKKVGLKINGKLTEVSIKTKLDLLLEKLGMDQGAGSQLKELKAPMPGMILQINVEEGAPVKKGDALIILEAMKMENIIKAPGDATIKSIRVAANENVEKNHVLIEFGEA